MSRLGEKYVLGLQDPPLEELLPFMSIYWFTDCYGSSIFFYKEVSIAVHASCR